MSSIKAIIRLFGKHKMLFFMTISVIMFVSSFSFIIPISFKILIDYIIVNKIRNLLIYFLLAIIVFIFLRMIFTFLQDYTNYVLRYKAEEDILSVYLDENLKLKIDRYLKEKPGELINRVTSFLNSFQFLMNNIIYYLFYAIFISISVSVILYYLNKILFIYIMIFFILHLVNYTLFSPFLEKMSNKYYTKKSEISSFLVQFFDGYVQVITSWIQIDFIKFFEKKIKDQSYYNYKREVYSNSQKFIQIFLISLNFTVIIYVGGRQVINNEITAGTLLLFLLLIGFVYEPIYRLNEVNKAFKDTGEQLMRLYEYIDVKEKDVNRKLSNNVVLDDILKIELKNLFFKYNDDKVIFKKLSYEFKKGNIYLIYGSSGEGKSTLFNILCGFYSAEKGDILINDFNVNDISLNQIRDKISLNLQDNFLFSTTIKNNIACFENSIDEEKIISAANISTSLTFIESLPYKFNTHLLNGGENLSGGQKKRICLARTFYDDKSVILLDEPTSSLDEFNEVNFMKNLNEIKENKIIMIISHNMKLKKYCDVALKISNGNFI